MPWQECNPMDERLGAKDQSKLAEESSSESEHLR